MSSAAGPVQFVALSGGNKMKRFLRTMMLAACAAAPLALVPAAPAMAQAVTRPSQDVNLSIGRGSSSACPAG